MEITSKFYLSPLDPDLKKDLEEQARLQNPDNVQPSLEKQETCIISATNYTYETIKELSIRHMVLLLRTTDARLHYFCYRQAEASGKVTTMPLYIVICIENLFNCWENCRAFSYNVMVK